MNNLVLKIEDESSDNDSSEASKTIDDANNDIGNIFYLKTTKSIYLRLWTYCLYFLRVFTLKVVSILYPLFCYTYCCLQNFLFKIDFLWHLD